VGIRLQAGDLKTEWNLDNYFNGLEKEILAELSAVGLEVS
jgi:hypothetical protein